MLDALEAESVHWGERLARAVQREDGKIDLHFGWGGVAPDYDLVIGADGACSKVRPLLTDATPLYSGISGLDTRISNVDECEPDIAQRVGQGMCLTLGPNRSILSQRNGNGELRTYAFLRTKLSWKHEDGLHGLSPSEMLRGHVERYYTDFSSDAKDMLLKADRDTVVPREMWMLPVGLRWRNRTGVTLIGDAAHLITPFAGVGVNVGMQDALELAEKLITHIKASSERPHWDAGRASSCIAAYEEAMFDRAESYARQTMMYLDLFFHERGGKAMVEHFDRVKAAETAS